MYIAYNTPETILNSIFDILSIYKIDYLFH